MKIKKVRVIIILSLIIGMITLPATIFAQEPGINYNTHYRFPVSIGVEYQSLSPFAEYGSTFNIYEVSGAIRVPIPPVPVLQPMLKFGMMAFDSRDPAEPEKWDNNQYFGMLGLLYSDRFSKNFEIGAELLGGYAHAVFLKLIPELTKPVGIPNLVFEGGAHINLDPSYNFTIDIHPNVKYLYSLSPLKDFDGLIFGIGFSGHFRFGQDPDAPGTIIRSIKFNEVKFQPLFAAMQSYYAKHPVGKVKITNTEKSSITDVEVSFYQKGYMDSPTPAAKIPELKGGASKEIGLLASFNDAVFKTEGITPLTGDIIVKYKLRGKPAEQHESVSYDLHDKTALTWDDNRKVAAFITPADSALRNYTSFIRQSCKKAVVSGYNEKLQIAMQVYHALGEIGVIYQVDPSSPFTKVQGNPMIVDSISLPRDTLKRITGDCDDLTVLYCSLLETAGIETGFITVPGHIYAAFNTGAGGREYKKVNPDRSMSINLDGKLWVPVEITMIGREDFLTAWREGIKEWVRYKDKVDVRGFYRTWQCQEIYRPVGLKETDLGLQYGNKGNIVNNFKKDMSVLVGSVIKEYQISAEKRGRKQDYNRLGVAYAKFGQYSKAEDAFKRALQIDPGYIFAQVNLGNIMFLSKKYQVALKDFTRALNTFNKKGLGKSSGALKVMLNISKVHYALKEYDKAKSFYDLAHNINPSRVEKYSYLAQVSGGETRGAAVESNEKEVLFLEEGE